MKKVEIELPDGLYEALEISVNCKFKDVSVVQFIEFLVISHILKICNLFEEKDPWKM